MSPGQACEDGHLLDSAGERRSRLSVFQESFWYIKEVDPKSGSFNVPRALRLRGPLRPDVLEAAVAWNVERQEILRARVEVVDGIPYQVAEDRRTQDYFKTLDLSHLEPRGAQATAMSAIGAEVSRQFIFGIGPLVRVMLIKISEDDHILLVVKPHLVTDASSMRIFIDEVACRYTLLLEGRRVAHDEPPVQFARYAALQRKDVAEPGCAEQIDYWRRQLRNAPPQLDLLEGGCRPRVRSFAGAERWSSLQADLVERPNGLAADAEVTLNVIVLSAFVILLSRKSGMDDLVVGTLIANRTRRQTAAMIGPLVNTFALRFDLAGDPTIFDILRRVKTVVVGAYRRHHLPFEHVIETLKSEQILDASFRLQYMFNFFEGEQATPRFGTIAAEKIRLDRNRSQADAMLGIHHEGHRIQAWCEYDASLYTERQIERLMQEYENVLRGLCDNLDRRLSGLPLLNQRQSREVLARWDATAVPCAPPSWAALLSARASHHPDVAAFTIEGDSLTFSALQRRSSQFARCLRDFGVGPQSTVALPAAASCNSVIALIGCLEVGCRVLQIADEWSDAEVSRVVSNVAPVVAFMNRPVRCAGSDRDPIVVDLASAIRESGSRSSARPTPETIGSGASAASRSTCFGQTDGSPTPVGFQDIWADSTPVVDDRRPADTLVCAETIEGVLASLARGRPVVGVSAVTNVEWLVQTIARSGVRQMMLPLHTLLELSRPEHGHRLALLEAVFCRARDLPPELARMVGNHLPRAALFQIYTSSAGLDLCCRQVHLERSAHIRVDRAMPGTAIRILDRTLQLAPVGVLGELYIGGTGALPDVFVRPTSLADQFIPDPFGPPGSLMYRTGERSRRRDDGALDLLGRIEDQIEIDGLLVDAGEVEAILERDAAIKHAVVVAGLNADGERHLVAYVVIDGAFDPIDKRHRLADLVPPSMVPSAFVPVDRFPLTASGELDRRTLSERMVAVEIRDDTPRTPHEVRLARLFADVLDLEAVGVHTSFLELGGHSLLALALASRIRKEFDVELPLHLLVEEATVAGLAKEISSRQVGAADLASSTGSRADA